MPHVMAHRARLPDARPRLPARRPRGGGARNIGQQVTGKANL